MDEDARAGPRLAVGRIVDQQPAPIFRHAPHVLAMHLSADLGARGDGVVGGRRGVVDAGHAVGDVQIARAIRRGNTEAAADL